MLTSGKKVKVTGKSDNIQFTTIETKIELFGHDSRNHLWRKDGDAFKQKNTVPTVKFDGGSIMVWGCFSEKGTGNVSVIDGRMNAAAYKNN